jgi:holo-[acyl-carrier protein] synthase
VRLIAGCDVVDIARLSRALDRRARLLDRVFTAREVADARRGGVDVGSDVERSRLAARFAAKEATRKALGELRLPFHDVEVRVQPDGAPALWVRGRPSALRCSLSHDGGIAMAVVVGLLDAEADVEPESSEPSEPSEPRRP